jgi:hypothetical protein
LTRSDTKATFHKPSAATGDLLRWIMQRPAPTASVVGALLAFPLWVVPYPPLLDMPQHAAAIEVLRQSLFTRAGHPIYEPNLAHSQYLAFHMLGAALAALGIPALIVCKVLLTAVAAATPAALASLMRSLGRDPRLALLAPLLFWNRALITGFLPYVASIPILLFALSETVHFARRPTYRSGLVLAVLAVATFYLHGATYLLLVCISAALTLRLVPFTHRLQSAVATPRKKFVRWLGALSLRLIWLAPSMLFAGFFMVFGKLAMHEGTRTNQEVDWMDGSHALYTLPLWVSDLFKSHVDEVISLLWWGLVLIVLFLGRARARHRGLLSVAALPFALSLLLYLAMPFRVGGGVFLNVRLAPVVALFALVLLGLPRGGKGDRLVVGGVLLSFAMGGFVGYESIIQSREIEGVQALLRSIPPEADVLQLNFKRKSQRSHLDPWNQIGAYHEANGGRSTTYSFASFRHWSIRYRSNVVAPALPGAFFPPCSFRNATHGPRFAYILVQGIRDPFLTMPRGPKFERKARAGGFVLYARAEGSWPDGSGGDLGPCALPLGVLPGNDRTSYSYFYGEGEETNREGLRRRSEPSEALEKNE